MKTVDPILGLGYDIGSLVGAVGRLFCIALEVFLWSHTGHLNFGENRLFENAKKRWPIELI